MNTELKQIFKCFVAVNANNYVELQRIVCNYISEGWVSISTVVLAQNPSSDSIQQLGGYCVHGTVVLVC